MLLWSSEIYQVQVFQQLHWGGGGGEGPTSIWPHRDRFFPVLTHTGLRGPSALLFSFVYTLPIPIYSSHQIITAPFPLPATLRCLMVLESSLAWDDMSLGHLEELSFALSVSLPILSALPGGHSPWWMRGRSQRTNSAVFFFACVDVMP